MIRAAAYLAGRAAGASLRFMLAGAEALAKTPVPGTAGGEAGPATGSAPGSGVPSVPCTPARDYPAWEPHPCHAWEFDDTALAATLDNWTEEASR